MTHRRRSRPRRTGRVARVVAIFAVLAVCALAVLAVALRMSSMPQPVAGAPLDQGNQRGRVVATTVAADDSARPVFPYSVIPGGAFSADELIAAARRDPVVAAHYAGVSQSVLRPERVREASAVYVSYRVGDEIYWTQDPVPLRPGEIVLTDGVNQIRARCGNRISVVAMGPTLPEDPDLEFDPLVAPERGAPGPVLGTGQENLTDLLANNALPFLGDPGTGFYPAPVRGTLSGGGGGGGMDDIGGGDGGVGGTTDGGTGGTDGGTGGTDGGTGGTDGGTGGTDGVIGDDGGPGASIPEPATMWLIGGGMAALVYRRLRRAR